MKLSQKGTIIFEQKEPLEPFAGAIGKIKLLDMQVNGIIPSRLRHVIKRYFKSVGFSGLTCQHLTDSDSSILRLVVEGRIDHPLKQELLAKVQYLSDRMIFVMNGGNKQTLPHASKADAELLRIELAKMEPRLSKAYYIRA